MQTIFGTSKFQIVNGMPALGIKFFTIATIGVVVAFGILVLKGRTVVPQPKIIQNKKFKSCIYAKRSRAPETLT